MWRTQGALGKLHNLIAHVTTSRKRIDLFKALQGEFNTSIAKGKRWKLLLDGGIQWNSSYMIIRRVFDL
jgi:hypothetical protein